MGLRAINPDNNKMTYCLLLPVPEGKRGRGEERVQWRKERKGREEDGRKKHVAERKGKNGGHIYSTQTAATMANLFLFDDRFVF